MSSNVYDFTLAAAVGATQKIDVSGSKALVRVASGGEVEIRTDNGRIYRCNEGQGLDLGRDEFNWLIVKNLQAVANIGLLSIGDGSWIDNRITGSVRVIDGAAEKTKASQQFIGSASVPALGAGVMGVLGLTAVIKQIALRRVTVSSALAGQMLWGTMTGTPTANYNPGLGQVLNKFSGASVSNANRFSCTSALASPSVGELPGRQSYSLLNVGVNTDTSIFSPIDSPIVIPVGSSFWVHTVAANRDALVVFDFEELA